MSDIKKYLTKIITEKSVSIDSPIKIEGQHGLNWSHLIDFIDTMTPFHSEIKDTLVKIDFHNGDIFKYLNHLAKAMIKAKGLDEYA